MSAPVDHDLQRQVQADFEARGGLTSLGNRPTAPKVVHLKCRCLAEINDADGTLTVHAIAFLCNERHAQGQVVQVDQVETRGIRL